MSAAGTAPTLTFAGFMGSSGLGIEREEWGGRLATPHSIVRIATNLAAAGRDGRIPPRLQAGWFVRDLGGKGPRGDAWRMLAEAAGRAAGRIGASSPRPRARTQGRLELTFADLEMTAEAMEGRVVLRPKAIPATVHPSGWERLPRGAFEFMHGSGTVSAIGGMEGIAFLDAAFASAGLLDLEAMRRAHEVVVGFPDDLAVGELVEEGREVAMAGGTPGIAKATLVVDAILDCVTPRLSYKDDMVVMAMRRFPLRVGTEAGADAGERLLRLAAELEARGADPEATAVIRADVATRRKGS